MTNKMTHHTTVLYTKYIRNTKNYFPPEPKKTNTTPQLYGTLSTYRIDRGLRTTGVLEPDTKSIVFSRFP
jgi:hypothetical protein